MSYEPYYDYILRKTREEREMQGELFNICTCANCKDIVFDDEAVVATYHQQHSTVQEKFCSTNCKHEWYLKRLNQLGM